MLEPIRNRYLNISLNEGLKSNDALLFSQSQNQKSSNQNRYKVSLNEYLKSNEYVRPMFEIMFVFR